MSVVAGEGAGAAAGGGAAGVGVAGADALSVLAGADSDDLASPLGGGTTVPSAAFLSPGFCAVLPFLKSVTYQPVPLSAKPAAEIFL